MVTTESYSTEQREFYFKAYKDLTKLEKDLNILKEDDSTALQISILGKVTQFYQDKNREISKDLDSIEVYWKTSLNKEIPFGDFNNSEIGNIFVVGTLVSIFLHKAGTQTLGTLSVGPFGILRGIGASETQANTCLKLLINGNYLLIFREFGDQIDKIKKALKD